jgi:hypothetical protein
LITSSAARTRTVSASLSSTGSVTSVAKADLSGEANLTTQGSVLFASELTKQGLSNLQAFGSVSADANLKFNVSSNLVSSSLLYGVLSGRTFFETSSLSSTSNIVSLGSYKANAVFDSTIEEAFRLTESGDTRITEDGDTRITFGANPNFVYGTLVALGTEIEFSAIAYIKERGAWRTFDPYVKFNDIWDEPQAIYKKIGNNWKRVY